MAGDGSGSNKKGLYEKGYFGGVDVADGKYGKFWIKSLELNEIAKSVPVGHTQIECEGGDERQMILLLKKADLHFSAMIKVLVNAFR